VKVYAIGEVDYDIRCAIPAAVYSTLEAAKAHAPDAVWEEDDRAQCWWGKDGRDEWAICTYVVDEQCPR
jgi:hypothetical protein